ncbi:MAG: DUF4383 domain-containing protein [Egibacteraceae bacterium]
MIKLFAKVVGVVLLLLGVVGLFTGGHLLGLVNVDGVEDAIHLVTGALFAYVGFAGTQALARTVVLVLGVIYVLVGIVGFFVPMFFGLAPAGFNLWDNLIHLLIGAIAVLVAVPAGRRVTRTA